MPFLAHMFAFVFKYTIYGIVKGLGKEKKFVPLVILFNTSSIFVILLLILIGVGEASVPLGCLFGEVCATISGIIIVLADWRKEADAIVNQT